VLHHDGSWSHEGVPFTNRRLRERFDRAVCYLPEERAFAVRIGRFRGFVEVEEAAFFVRSFDPDAGAIGLSDGSRERLDPSSLGVSPRDGALLCRVKRDLAPPRGLLARFGHAAQAELLSAVEATPRGPRLRAGGALHRLPDLG